MFVLSTIPIIPVQQIYDSVLQQAGISLYIKRLDLTHPHISGNKWYKLKYNLEEARKQNKNTLLTFGGAYSNHIVATAAVGKEFGFDTIGIIRGEKILPLNSALEFAEKCGMKLEFVSREDYKKKEDENFIYSLSLPFGEVRRGSVYLIPEGGSNMLAVKGCMEILNGNNEEFNYICCACGTGTTLAGIALSLKEKQQAIGFSVLKGEDTLTDKVRNLMIDYFANSEMQKPTHMLRQAQHDGTRKWEINTNYHFGGYAKSSPDLLSFMNRFYEQHKIKLDFVYTGKMMAGIYDLVAKKYFKRGSKIVAIHTGGINAKPPSRMPKSQA